MSRKYPGYFPDFLEFFRKFRGVPSLTGGAGYSGVWAKSGTNPTNLQGKPTKDNLENPQKYLGNPKKRTFENDPGTKPPFWSLRTPWPGTSLLDLVRTLAWAQGGSTLYVFRQPESQHAQRAL